MFFAVKVLETFLFDVKKMLVSWGYDMSLVKVDLDANTKCLSIGQERVVSASILDGEFSCQWEGAWSSWPEFQNSDELKALFGKTGHQ